MAEVDIDVLIGEEEVEQLTTQSEVDGKILTAKEALMESSCQLSTPVSVSGLSKQLLVFLNQQDCELDSSRDFVIDRNSCRVRGANAKPRFLKPVCGSEVKPASISNCKAFMKPFDENSNRILNGHGQHDSALKFAKTLQCKAYSIERNLHGRKWTSTEPPHRSAVLNLAKVKKNRNRLERREFSEWGKGDTTSLEL